MKQLILGGARSGKSSLAEQLAKNSGKSVIYIATTNTVYNDDEMHSRIQHHQQRRPSDWQTVETPLQLAKQLVQLASPGHCLLIDCLTLWLTNCLMEPDAEMWPQQRKALLDCLANLPGDVILVGNEVGSGVVPLGELNRRFVDENGFL
ncbi:MAG TPA: bifunctional adenosylcobinamide kinase/adenosylcobinamide-phosphate guanylyltransferase, partial [Porticoccus sp.]|nr:bifunctional adenosylcobinamide kinase/adenosylcobinamide-phosphate guanylyltransferase [Porticoccus sp.]